MQKIILLVLDKFCQQAVAPLTPCPPTQTSNPTKTSKHYLSLLEETVF